MRIFVILFNARSENEGIHTLKAGDRNVVLMFENEEDAARYSLMLEAQDLPSPSVEAFELEDIEEFCGSAGYEYKLVPEGTLAIPPEQNVDKTDWDPDAEAADEFPAADETGLSEAELAQIRQQLEGLL
ncbi:MAG: DUF3110 domain-containing protein [Leptolyngbya sp. SIO4C5]|uniref:DUF3110 domain-containing protein n=1 Tax=Sphaerothrix gracilis TaxID=3151835 RepID=UPI0013BFF998|nr:DUF3110 domain-containing protein [Leptolyngbya sp. SIO4C5]